MTELILKNITGDLARIATAAIEGRRLTPDEALTLYNDADLSLMGLLATTIKRRKSGDAVFFNRNFHIEPTNICVYIAGSVHTTNMKATPTAGNSLNPKYLIL
jgi:aminodeoxyfutalosine synthase